MTISLNQIGKRYRENWIFKGITYTFLPGSRYGLLGPNGSGKSTLMRIISGMQSANSGNILYEHAGKPLVAEKIYAYTSYCAPGMELPEEMRLAEFLQFHFSFKKLLPGLEPGSLLRLMGLEHAADTFIHDYSSGMKQRVKLAQAFFSDTPVLLLDEPCSNLDRAGLDLYREWMSAYGANRTVIIASNDRREYEQAEHILSLEPEAAPV